MWPSLATLWLLYVTFFNIGILCFGGGYAAVQLSQEQTVNIHHWMTMGDFGSIVTMSEMTPGPIALNVATFVGARQGGLLGSIVATLGLISGPCLITSLLAFIYQKYKDCPALDAILKGIKPAVLGMLVSVALSFVFLAMRKPQILEDLNPNGAPTINPASLIVIALSVYALHKKIIGPITLICLTGFTSLIIEFFCR